MQRHETDAYKLLRHVREIVTEVTDHADKSAQAAGNAKRKDGPVIRGTYSEVIEVDGRDVTRERLVQIYDGRDFPQVLGFPTPEAEHLEFFSTTDQSDVPPKPIESDTPHYVVQIGYNGLDPQPRKAVEPQEGVEPYAEPKGIRTYAVFRGTPYRVDRRMTLPASEDEPLNPTLPRQVVLTRVDNTTERGLIAQRAFVVAHRHYKEKVERAA